MALPPSSFIVGQSIVAYYTSAGVKVPALVEAVSSATPPIMSLFVGPGQFHVDGVAYSAVGDAGCWSFDVAETITVGQSGSVGAQTDPYFVDAVQNAGINEPERATFYNDSDEGPIKVAGLENTGTYATVRRTRGSHFEGFSPDGVGEPTFRLNSYPEGQMLLQMGAGGCVSAATGMVRATNVVTVTTTWPHGFGVGQGVNLGVTVAGSGASFAAGNYTVASVADSTHFTYAETASDSTSSGIGYWSAPVDVEIQRVAYNQLGLAVGGARKLSIYADSMTTEDSIRLATAGSFECSKISSSTSTPYTLGVEYGLLMDATAGVKTVNLPAAASCKGRKYFIKKTDASGNNVTLTRASSDTIDGATTFDLTTQYNFVKVISDGVSGWWVEGSKVG